MSLLRFATRRPGRAVSSARRARIAPCRRKVEELNREVAGYQAARAANAYLERLLKYERAPSFPQDANRYNQVAAQVLTSPTVFDQTITIAAGSNRNITVQDVVITADGLVGQVTKVDGVVSRVMLITDPDSAVRAVDEREQSAIGILEPGSPSDTLSLTNVGKDKKVQNLDTVVTAGSPGGGSVAVDLPGEHPDRQHHERRPERDRHLQADPGATVRRLLLAPVGARARSQSNQAREEMIDAVKAAVVLFVAVVTQASILGGYSPLGGSADLLLVVVLSLALLRGAVFGAVAGFGAGLLLDVANLSTLGFTSLLLTIAGFWIGRYGETTARDRFHAPYVSVLVVTVLYAFCALALRFVLGERVPAHAVLTGLPAGVLWNLILTWPIYGAHPAAVPAGRSVRPHLRRTAPCLGRGAHAAFSPAIRGSRSRIA